MSLVSTQLLTENGTRSMALLGEEVLSVGKADITAICEPTI
jgi:hypothetical protein